MLQRDELVVPVVDGLSRAVNLIDDQVEDSGPLVSEGETPCFAVPDFELNPEECFDAWECILGDEAVNFDS